ncbi:MAG: hypothetical protein N3C60_03665 [Calditerrivibrio sp.]|nr:hypothetical protein [Calditerrivibrio sp.]
MIVREYVSRIYDLVEKKKFNHIVILELLEILNQLDVPINPDKKDKETIRRLKKEFKVVNGTVDKFIILLYSSLLEYCFLSKEEAKKEYISNLVDLNFNHLFLSHFRVLGDIVLYSIKAFYPDINQLLGFYSKTVLKGSIWNKNEDEQKLNLLWFSQVLMSVYNTNREFWNIYENVVGLYREALKRGKLEVLLTWNFSINHVFMNVAQTQEEFGKICSDLDKPLSEFLADKGMQILQLKPVEREISNNSPIRVGFVYDRIVFNSPFKVLYSLLKGLIEVSDGKCEYFVYDIETMEKSLSDNNCIKMITDLGIRYFSCQKALQNDELVRGHLYNRVKKCLIMRERIIKDDIDILVMCNSNFLFTFLYSTRAAPKQIYWSHGNFVWDVIGIDKRITHCGVKDTPFEFTNFIYPPVVELFYNPPVDMNKVAQERGKYPKDVFILGTIGRLIKTDSDEYLETVAEIMKKCPNTIFIAAGTGDQKTIREKVEKLEISDRFYMPGFVDPHIYGHIIDLWLDTFPLGHGESVWEYRFKKKGVVQLISYDVLEKYLCDILKDKDIYNFFKDIYKQCEIEEIKSAIRNSPFVAFDKEEYCYKVVKLLTDIEYFRNEVDKDYIIFSGHLNILYKKGIKHVLNCILGCKI